MTTATRQPAPSTVPRSVPVPARPHARPRAEAIWHVSDRAALVVLAGICGLLVALTWGTWGDLTQDTGYELVAATRVAHGEVPYSDFIYYYGPLGPALLGAFYAVFGTSIGVAMAFGLGVATAIVGLTYAVARMLVPPVGAMVAAGLAAVPAFGADNNSFVMPHSLSAPLAILLTLALVGALGRRSRGGSRAWLPVGGAALGGLALTRPEFLLAGSVAAAAWVALQLVIGRPAGLRRAAGDAARIAGPALLIPALVYGGLLTQVSLHDLLNRNLFPVGPLREGAGHVLKISAPLTASSFAELLGRLALYAAAAGALVGLGVALERPRLRRAAALTAAAGAVLFLGVLAVRPELMRHGLQFVYGWIPAGAVIATGFLAARAWRRRSLSSAEQVALVLLAALSVVSLKTYAAFFPHPNPVAPQAAEYAMPLAAIFLAWLHVALPARHPGVRILGLGWLALLVTAGIVLSVGDARRETVTVRGPGGALTATPQDGPAYQAALRAITATTGPGDPILLAPQMSALYVISQRSNPLPEISLLPGALAGSPEQRQAISRMRAVQFAVTSRDALSEYGAGAFGTGYDRLIGGWLRTNFSHTQAPGGVGTSPQTTLDIWQRSAAP